MSTSGEEDGDESLLNEDDDEESPTPEGYGRRDIRNRTNWLNRFDAVRIVHIRAANALFQSFEELMMLTTSLITYYMALITKPTASERMKSMITHCSRLVLLLAHTTYFYG